MKTLYIPTMEGHIVYTHDILKHNITHSHLCQWPCRLTSLYIDEFVTTYLQYLVNYVKMHN